MEHLKYRAIDRLRDYQARVAALETLPLEIERLRIEGQSIKASTTDKTPVQGGGTTHEDRMISNIVKRADMEALLEQDRLAVACIDKGLKALDNGERQLLERMYIYRETGAVERIRQELGLQDDRNVYRRCDKALKRFTIALYGITEM